MKQIAVCGVSDDIVNMLEKNGGYQYMSFEDKPPERGEVRLAQFLKQGGELPDLVVVGSPGAAGLTACDYLRSRWKTIPILWVCDREEFETEAKQLDTAFLCQTFTEEDNTEKLFCVIRELTG